MNLRTHCRRALGCAAFLGWIVLASCSGGKAPSSASPPARGNLSLVDLRVHQIVASDAEPRLVIQVLVENDSALDRDGAYEVLVRRGGATRTLASCRGDHLPRTRVALCDIWLVNEAALHGDVFEAVLNRSVDDFGAWDAKPEDDRRTLLVRAITEGGEVLQLDSFDVGPSRFQGPTDVYFRFRIEGAHLAWLLVGDRPPRLLAGHPADALLTGNGRERINTSTPLVLVARNSFGAYIYQTYAVFNAEQQPAPAPAPPPEPPVEATLSVLEPGMFDVDEDEVILEKIRSHLASRDWARAVKAFRPAELPPAPAPSPATATPQTPPAPTSPPPPAATPPVTPPKPPRETPPAATPPVTPPAPTSPPPPAATPAELPAPTPGGA